MARSLACCNWCCDIGSQPLAVRGRTAVQQQIELPC